MMHLNIMSPVADGNWREKQTKIVYCKTIHFKIMIFMVQNIFHV